MCVRVCAYQTYWVLGSITAVPMKPVKPSILLQTSITDVNTLQYCGVDSESFWKDSSRVCMCLCLHECSWWQRCLKYTVTVFTAIFISLLNQSLMDVLGEVLIYHNGSIYEFTLHKCQITSCLLDSLRNRLDTRWQERSAVYSSSDPETWIEFRLKVCRDTE